MAVGGNDQLSGGGAVEKCVDIPSAGDFEFGEAREWAEGGNDFLGDDFGRLAQLARQLKGDGRGNLAQTQFGRRLERDRADLQIVFFFEDGAKAITEPLFEFQNHAMSLRKMVDFPSDFSICGQAAPRERRAETERARDGSRSAMP